MKNTTILGMVIVLILVGGYFMFSNTSEISGNDVAPIIVNGEVQEVVIGMKNYNYYPDKIEVDVGNTVRLSLDDSAYGCFRDFTIKELGVRKYLKTSKDYVEFTPTKPGTYTFACSMGMGVGKLVVK